MSNLSFNKFLAIGSPIAQSPINPSDKEGFDDDLLMRISLFYLVIFITENYGKVFGDSAGAHLFVLFIRISNELWFRK